MFIYTDDPAYAAKLLPKDPEWQAIPATAAPAWLHAILKPERLRRTEITGLKPYPLMLIIGHAPASPFDIIHEKIRAGAVLPDVLVVLSDSGDHFHGFHGRSWEALKGNLHLTVLFKPKQPIEFSEGGVIALPAVSAVEAIDRLVPGRSGIKWVNDIVIGGAKAGGVLVRTRMTGRRIDAIIVGIGLNIERTPVLPPDPFIPATTCLNQFGNFGVGDILWLLLERLWQNYLVLSRDNAALLNHKYRDYNVVTGREVAIYSDSPGKVPDEIQRGLVTGIGQDLELYLNTSPEPVRHGRLAFVSDMLPAFF